MSINIDWAAIGIITAFLLGIFNIAYNLHTSKRTTYINAVTAERVKWINNLRDNISNFCGRTYYWTMHPNFAENPKSKESLDVIAELDRIKMLIKLQLNPTGSYDKQIINLIDDIKEYTGNMNKMKELTNGIIETSQLLLKEEWDKVKLESKIGDPKDYFMNKTQRKLFKYSLVTFSALLAAWFSVLTIWTYYSGSPVHDIFDQVYKENKLLIIQTIHIAVSGVICIFLIISCGLWRLYSKEEK